MKLSQPSAISVGARDPKTTRIMAHGADEGPKSFQAEDSHVWHPTGSGRTLPSEEKGEKGV